MAGKKKTEEAKGGAPEWMATYGDLVTLLLCFFVLLYAMGNIDQTKFAALAASFSGNPSSLIDMGGSAGVADLLGNGIMELPDVDKHINDSKENQEKSENAEKEAAELMKKMGDMYKTYFAEHIDVQVEVTESYIKMMLPESVLFASGEAKLYDSAAEIIDIIGGALMQTPDCTITIEGHTDTVPINTAAYPNNWYLSGARASSVATELMNRFNIAGERIIVAGHGEHIPIASNDTPEGRAQNRRVEIRIETKISK